MDPIDCTRGFFLKENLDQEFLQKHALTGFSAKNLGRLCFFAHGLIKGFCKIGAKATGYWLGARGRCGYGAMGLWGYVARGYEIKARG